MAISQAADFTAIAGETIMDMSTEEYLNMHLAHKTLVEGREQAKKDG